MQVAGQQEILYGMWQRACAPGKRAGGAAASESWQLEVHALYTLGIGMEETLRHLYHNKPPYNDFIKWIEERKKEALPDSLPYDSEADVLTQEDLDFWSRNGYLVVKQVISPQQCADTQKAIWEFLQMDPADPATWYKSHEELRGMMLLFTQHATLEANRNSPVIRKAFEQLYGSAKIYKTIDKVSFNPPEKTGFRFSGSSLHWDVSLTLPIPYKLQGLLYLTDCGADEGAFHCVPGFQHKIADWLTGLPAGSNPREEVLRLLVPEPVPGRAGDLVIWHQALPHCATPNRGAKPRLVQYITYLPTEHTTDNTWI